MKQLLQYIWAARTTTFGYVQVTLGVLAAADGIFSQKALKWVILVNGVITACLGHYNNLRIRQAERAAEPPP